MGKSISNNVFFFLALGVSVFSCASRKELASPTEGNERKVSRAERQHIMNSVIEQQLDFRTFSARAKSRITINNKETYDVTANIRIVRDEAIWVSVTAMMGIEAGRLLITPDSVKIINRLRGEFHAKPFDYVYTFASRELDFSSLQDLLVGNVIAPALGPNVDVSVIETGGSILRGGKTDLAYLIQLGENSRPALTLLEEVEQDQRLEATYTEYSRFDERLAPGGVTLSIYGGRHHIQSQMSYTRVAYDEALEVPFSIPAKYNEIQ